MVVVLTLSVVVLLSGRLGGRRQRVTFMLEHRRWIVEVVHDLFVSAAEIVVHRCPFRFVAQRLVIVRDRHCGAQRRGVLDRGWLRVVVVMMGRLIFACLKKMRRRLESNGLD